MVCVCACEMCMFMLPPLNLPGLSVLIGQGCPLAQRIVGARRRNMVVQCHTHTPLHVVRCGSLAVVAPLPPPISSASEAPFFARRGSDLEAERLCIHVQTHTHTHPLAVEGGDELLHSQRHHCCCLAAFRIDAVGPGPHNYVIVGA